MQKTFLCTVSNDKTSTLICTAIEAENEWKPVVETCLPVTDGLVDFWTADREPCPFISGKNVAHYCGAITDGFIREDGTQGEAFAIRGSGVIATVASVPALEPEFLTIAAWVRGPQSDDFRWIVAKGASNCDSPSYGLYTTSTIDEIRFIAYDGSNFGVASAIVPGIWDGNWHFVVGTYDGIEVALYVDQNLVDTTPYTGTIDYNLSPGDDLTIGGYDASACPPSSNNYSFPGDIDQVTLYNRPLSANEILALYNAGSDGNCAN